MITKGDSMKWLENIPQDAIVIIPSSLKKKIIYEMNQMLNHSYKIMTMQEVESLLSFTFTKDALYFLATTCHLSIPIAKMYMDNMKYMKQEKVKTPKLEKIQIYFEVLKQYNKLRYSHYGPLLFKGRSIYIAGFDFFTLLENYYIEELKQLGDVHIITPASDSQHSSIQVYEFSHIQEEVEYVASLLAKKIEEGVACEHLHLIGVSDEYKSYIERIFSFYQLPFPDIQKQTLYTTRIGKEFLSHIKKYSPEETIALLQKEYSTLNERMIIQECVRILNQYAWYDGNLLDLYDYILEDVKEKTISIDTKKAVISFDSSILHTCFSEDDYVYILGANQGSLPPIVKDESYITDDCCKETYKEDSVCTNKMNREGTKQSLLRIPNLYMSYTLSNDNGVCYPSALLQELPVQIVKPTWDWKHNYGGDYNKIKMASQLDQLRNYNEYTPSLTLLTSTYDVHDYLSYHHEFTPVANFHYHPVLSYTSLSSYMECAFKYYLTYILKLNEFEESFSQKVGNIYHYILSLWTKPKEELEAILQEQVKEASFEIAEKVWWNPLEQHLWDIIDVLKEQQLCTDFTSEEHEKEVIVELSEKIKVKGIIDKIMSYQKDGITYHALVDYKTGNTDISLKHLKYGFSMQLPFYLFLLMHTKKQDHEQVVGFYLQKCLQYNLHTKHGESLEKQKKDSLKLEGYSLNEEAILSHLDKTYENSELIKGLKTTKSGFSSFAKLVTKQQILEINQQMEQHILDAWHKINQGDFKINPKVLENKNRSCTYCPFQDICFKTNNDTVYLGGENDG